MFYEWENCTLRSLLKQSMQKAGYQTTLPIPHSNKIRILLNCRAGRKVRKSGWCCASTTYCASFLVMWLDIQQARCQKAGPRRRHIPGMGHVCILWLCDHWLWAHCYHHQTCICHRRWSANILAVKHIPMALPGICRALGEGKAQSLKFHPYHSKLSW